MNGKIKFIGIGIIIGILIGGVCAGFFVYRQGIRSTGELNRKFNQQLAGTTEVIGRLEGELEREREFNRQLREHNNRARDIADELTGSAKRNVRNLQDAVGLIGEIRRKLQVLADFYADSDTCSDRLGGLVRQ